MAVREFKRIVRGVGLTAGTVNIDDNVCVDGEHITYGRVVVENLTSNGSIVRIQVIAPVDTHLAAYFAAFNSAVPQRYDTAEILVERGEFLRVSFTGTTTGDVLEVHLWGFTLYDAVRQ